MEQEPKQRRARPFRRAGLCLLAVAVLTGGGSSAWAAPTAPAAACAAAGDMVIPLGQAVGIKLFSQGVLVVGMSQVETQQGSRCPGEDCGLQTGDVITHVDGREVNTVEEIQQVLSTQSGEALKLRALRGEQSLQLTAQPVENTQGQYQLGVWLRDSMAGIGTLTFYHPASGTFAALGHGVNDVDTAMLMPLGEGSIMPATVSDVKQGQKGQPGELHGSFDLTKDLGTLYANTDAGIFGRADQNALARTGQAIPVASREEVATGPAVIRANVRGDQIEEFDVEILRVYPEETGETRCLMLRVTDPELLGLTGGIVQGMSGSPILQNGKLVGAVTHVLIDDPTRGYGILAETMLSAVQLEPISSAA